MRTLTVPAGKYYLGDPCYTVPTELWDELLDSCDCFNYETGKVNGYTVYAFGTAYGDGVYLGSDGHEYPVDAGLIGLVPVELNPKPMYAADPFTVVEFDVDTLCFNQGGYMTFGNISIDTTWGDGEDEDEDEYFEEDDE